MIYVFKTPFVNSKGRIIPKGEKAFINNLDQEDELTQEVKRRIEEEKKKKKALKKKVDGDVH
jgi:hypothetical protein